MGASTTLPRLRTFFTERVWDVRLTELPRARRAGYRLLRVLSSAVTGFVTNGLTVRAAALTYYSVLSIVPFLAFTFAVLKGFGAYTALIQGTVRPWLDDTFGANPSLHQALLRILEFVEKTNVSSLGAVGLLALVYTSVSLVSSVEAALNTAFGARATRPPLRQLTDYVTLLVTTPLLLFVAATLSTAAQSSWLVVFLRDQLQLGRVIDLALGLTPIVVVGLALFAMYVILPNVQIRPRSALLGAAVAALGWEGTLILHVQLQMGVARYNALYSVLGALPIFLVWTYVSWLVVLAGAELAASHQNEPLMRERLRGKQADQALRETLAVAAVARVTCDFLAGGPRRTTAELAEALEVPALVVEDILDALVRAGVLVRVVAGAGIAFLPGRDPGDLRAADVREALRRDPRADPVRAGVERQLGPELQALLAAFEEERRRSPLNLTLRELAARVPGAPAAPTGPRPPAPDADGTQVLDPKQPEVPA
ncbi:MAG: YhjD/YihY/BrkB family envelope integrity protein [Anaeromyxobacter sp.]